MPDWTVWHWQQSEGSPFTVPALCGATHVVMADGPEGVTCPDCRTVLERPPMPEVPPSVEVARFARFLHDDAMEADLRCGYDAFAAACVGALADGGGVRVYWDGTIERLPYDAIEWLGPEVSSP